ncbi:cell division protein FtsA [bacterium]|nr:cell division protein FtsA [bacterium]
MAKKAEATYVGLDIGTSKITCVVGLHQEDAAEPSIIGLGTAPTTGLRRGVVTDIEETVSSITAALEEAERMSGTAIERATISVDGAHVQSLNSRGVIAVSRADHEISREDLLRAEEAAAAIQIDNNRQILQIIPKNYIVDGQSNIADPVGMNGVRLEVDTHIITAATPALKNLDNAVFRAGVTINDQVIVPLAAAKAVLTKRQRELGVVLMDIGAETTGLVVFEEGNIAFTTIIPVGSNHITKDLVFGLQTTIDVAEKVKLKHATAGRATSKDATKVSLDELGGKGAIAKHEIDKIVQSRLGEIFTMAVAELRKAGKDSMLAAGVVLTGGGAKMIGIADFAKDAMKMPVAVGAPTGITGLTDKVSDPAYAAAVGLMLEDMEQPLDNLSGINNILGNAMGRVKAIFKSLMP